MGKRYKHEKAELLAEVREGRATVREAADRLGVARPTAYFWVRRAGLAKRSAARKRVATFVELVPRVSSDSSMTVRAGGAEIDVRVGFDPGLLRAVVAALRGETT